MQRRRSLINRSAIKARFASAGYRASQEILDHLEAILSVAVKAGIKGMVGRGRLTVTVEEMYRGKLLGDPTRPPKASHSRPSRRKVNRGLLRR